MYDSKKDEWVDLCYINRKLKGKRTIRELNNIEDLSSDDEWITENNEEREEDIYEVEDETFKVQKVENVAPCGTVDDLDQNPVDEIEMRDIDDDAFDVWYMLEWTFW